MNIKHLNLLDLKPNLPLPGKEELHVWTIPANCIDNLHKNQHEYSQTLLRKMISAYTGISEKYLEFATGKHGKPSLLNVPNLNFNLSHSGAYLVFVFSCSGPVGIDIERTNRKADMDKIAARVFFPSEAEQLKNLREIEKRDLFFRLWTRTESFLKGIGTGLSSSLKDKKIQKEYTLWTIQHISAPEGYVCCIAWRSL